MERCETCGSGAIMLTGECSWCAVLAIARRESWRRALPVLAANLAIGAGLCESWRLSFKTREVADDYRDGVASDEEWERHTWWPGCQRPAHGRDGEG